MQHRCDVQVLGGFGVTVDDRRVEGDAWRNRRAADLVKLLALEPAHVLHREQVMEALWPSLAAAAAAANLRKAVHFARRALGSDDAIAVVEGTIQLWPDASVTVDRDRFLEEAGQALGSSDPAWCTRVAARYAGDVLPADRYEPWVQRPRADTQDTYVSLLKAAGDWHAVLALDQTDEEAHRALMQGHLDAGNRREAIRQFERLRDVLREHIGVGPDPATVALYEKVLAMEGDEPASPSERAAALLANGLVAWGRGDVEEADRLARSARTLALDAGLGHELGEASTLQALIAYARGNWHDVFREQFVESLSRPELSTAVFDAHLCFSEFYLYGPEGHAAAAAFARELLDAAEQAKSAAGTALATLLLGEFELLSGNIDAAVDHLHQALKYAEEGDHACTISLALERLAEAEIERGHHAAAQELLARARPVAERSAMPSHLVVRLLGMQVRAAQGPIQARQAVREAERWLAEAFHVCEPCSMNLHIDSARVWARTGDLPDARRHLAEVEHISRLWAAGPWQAATWELRAELRRAQGDIAQASALYLEAADGYAAVRRPVDEIRCREAAALAGATT